MSNWIRIVILRVLTMVFVHRIFAQAQEPVDVANPSGYLLLDKGLQYRITKAINRMYNFDFATAEHDFKVIMYQYPDHPLPDFLMALGYWWRIEVDVA